METRKVSLNQCSFFMEQLINYKFSYHGKLVQGEPYDTTAFSQIWNKLYADDGRLAESTYKFFLKLLWNNKFQELEVELDKLN